MRKVAIITDSAASIPDEMAHELGISVIPMQIVKDGEAFTLGRDITASEVYGAMREGKVLKTSQPLVPHIVEAYERALTEADQVISIHVSSKLTSTAATCMMAADMVDPGRIRVMDSCNLTILYGLGCIKAARLALAGFGAGECAAAAESVIGRIRGWLAVPSLKYLAQSGRVSRVLSTIGTLLSIKLILRMGEGEVHLADKYRTSRNGLEKLLDRGLAESGGQAETLCFVHADNLEEARLLSELVLPSIRCEEHLFTDIGPTIGVHIGPGPVGLAVLPGVPRL